ncbi:MAG: hypothetical protein FJ288_07065 [Planctomycetes bacterium]|nr:hypothetical protein [Planctomycetota bacterium]
MHAELRDRFTALWQKYFPGAELPLAFYYTDGAPPADARPRGLAPCVIANLGRVREGRTLALDTEAIGCPGGRRYLGFAQGLRPGLEHFLSCGIPGKMAGERYKKTPQLVLELLKHMPPMQAPARWIVFKRWDALADADEPAAVIFLARPDVLAGLFTLANFDAPDQWAVIPPFAAGCGAIVQYPYQEGLSARPRAVLGMFDVSARPFVPPDTLSFAAPWAMFRRMVDNMDESFLITGSWDKVRARLSKSSPVGPA